jgi:hypothetical protein
MNDNNLQQFTTAKKSVELLHHQVQQCVTIAELNERLATFNTYILKIANHKNNRTNKNISAFVQYFIDQKKFAHRNSTAILEKQVLQNVKHRVSYKDYRSEMIKLRERGLSYQKISNYAQDYWNITVSKDTIRNYLNETK